MGERDREREKKNKAQCRESEEWGMGRNGGERMLRRAMTKVVAGGDRGGGVEEVWEAAVPPGRGALGTQSGQDVWRC